MAKKRKEKKGSKKSNSAKDTSFKNTKQFGFSNLTIKQLIALLSIITLFTYSPVLFNDFVELDDDRLIVSSELVTNGNWSNLDEIFDQNKLSPFYRPLTVLTWKLEYQLFGSNPLAYHINNLILHLLNVILLFLILIRLSRYSEFMERHKFLIAFFVALFFSINPTRVEAVVWAVERKDLLFSFFYLLGIWAYLKYIQEDKLIFLIGSLLCYTLGLLSKSPTITLIAVIVLIDIFSDRFKNKKSILEKVPYLILFLGGLALYGLFTNFDAYATGLVNGIVNDSGKKVDSSLNHLPAFYQRILIINYRIQYWIQTVLIPTDLSVIRSRNVLIESVGLFIHAFPIINLGLIFLAFYSLKFGRYIFLAIGFFFITISPAIAISDTGIGVFVPERYTYLPAIGIFLFIIGAIIYGIEKNKKFNLKSAILLFSFVSILYVIMSMKRIPVWKNNVTLWTDVIKKYPKISDAYVNRAIYYKKKNQNLKALADYTLAIKYDPNMLEAHVNKGNIYLNSNDFATAIKSYNRVIEIDPNYYSAYLNRGVCYGKSGQVNNALKDLNKAISLEPDNIEGYLQRVLAYFELQDFESALPDYQKILELDPKNYTIWHERGVIHQNLGMQDKALKDFNEAVKLKPNSAVYLEARAAIYQSFGETEKANRDLEKAASLK